MTGVEDVTMQCQFCVNDEPHAVLLLPESTSFLVSQPVVGVNCITAQVVGDKRILFCRGAQQTTFTFIACFDNAVCARPDAGGYEGIAAWWSSVQQLDVNSVTVLENDGTNAWVRVNVTFHIMDGRVISDPEYDYDLSFDAARQTWMFDYRT